MHGLSAITLNSAWHSKKPVKQCLDFVRFFAGGLSANDLSGPFYSVSFVRTNCVADEEVPKRAQKYDDIIDEYIIEGERKVKSRKTWRS